MRSRRSSRPSWSRSVFTFRAAGSLSTTPVACVSCTVMFCPPTSEGPAAAVPAAGQHRRGGASSHCTAPRAMRRGTCATPRRLPGREAEPARSPQPHRGRPRGADRRGAGQGLRQGPPDAQAQRGPGPPSRPSPAAADHPQGGLPADAGEPGRGPDHRPLGRGRRQRGLPPPAGPGPGEEAGPRHRRRPAERREPLPRGRRRRRRRHDRPQPDPAQLRQLPADALLPGVHRRLGAAEPADQAGHRRAAAEGEPEGRRLVRHQPLHDDPALALPEAAGQDRRRRLRGPPVPPRLARSARAPEGWPLQHVTRPGLTSRRVEYRRLGRSGLTISEIAYGNWLTHGGQVEEDAAQACVRAALDVGITTFDTADVYAGTRAESVLGRALAGRRREGLEIFTKVYWPTGPGPNDRGLSRKHIIESCNASLKRLQTDYVDLYQAHRYDETVPLEETMTAFADLVRQGKALYIGVSEWRADEIAAGAALARDLGVQLISNQPQYSMLWRGIEQEVIPTSEKEGVSQIVGSPRAQGVLTGKYLPGQQPPADSRGAHATAGGAMQSFLTDELLTRVQQLRPIADELGLTMAQLAVAWVLQNPNVAAAIIGASRPEQGHDNVQAAGVTLDDDVLKRIDEVLGDVVERDPAKTQRG